MLQLAPLGMVEWTVIVRELARILAELPRLVRSIVPSPSSDSQDALMLPVTETW